MTAINLALALSQDVNTWVFLVDLDLQRPQIANYLGMSFEKGLSDYLLGKAELEDVVYNLQSERLGVIPNARAFQHSSEFLNSPAHGRVHRGARARDAAPHRDLRHAAAAGVG